MANDTNNSTAVPTGLIQATDYKFQCSIITSDGRVNDVTTLVLFFNLYESIFDPCMTGDIGFSDALDFITNLNLHGNEYVYILLDKPGLNKPIEKYFRIYKISNRGQVTQAAQNYMIYFCSEEFVLSSQVHIKKAYKGLSIDAIVSDILKGVLQVSSDKISNIEKTSGNFDFVIPKMHPIEAINWASSRAYGDNKNLFFFFENRDGYNLTSYESMIAQDPYTTYVKQPSVLFNPDQNISTIKQMHTENDFNIIRANRVGQFASNLTTYDFVNRTLKKYTNNGNKLPSSRYLNPNLPANLSKNRLGLSLYDAEQAHSSLMFMDDSDPTANKFNPDKWLLQNQAKLAQLQAAKITIAVAADFLVKSGSVVNLSLPMMKAQVANQESLDKYKSAKYLVSSVRHGIVGEIATTTLELLSDSLGDSLPSSDDGSGSLQTLKSS